jgi:putative SOS response-associated peptidase YedK
MIGTGAPLRWPNRDPPTGDFRVYPNVRTLYHHLACGRGQGFVRLRRTAQFPPRYNVALTQPIPIVRLVDGARWCALVRRGFLPAWVKDPKTFSNKPSFRNAMRWRRCLIPADGFYE